VRIDVSRSGRWVLKRMRRGGFLRFVWRDRFSGARRLLANLTTPVEARRRGIPTAAPVALLLRRGPPGFYRAWMALEEIEGASDLRARFSTVPPAAVTEMSAVLACVRRMHDAGIEHRDLNVGNLLIRAGERVPEVFVVDLDRVVLHDGPVSFRRRQSALRRLERSWVKTFGDAGPAGAPDAASWYSWYAGDDEEVARRLRAGRTAGRAWLAFHRMGWREKR